MMLQPDSVVTRALSAGVLLALITIPVNGQANGQLWGTVTVNWLKSDRLTYEVELEPEGAGGSS
jgi:hypothetical protein